MALDFVDEDMMGIGILCRRLHAYFLASLRSRLLIAQIKNRYLAALNYSLNISRLALCLFLMLMSGHSRYIKLVRTMNRALRAARQHGGISPE